MRNLSPRSIQARARVVAPLSLMLMAGQAASLLAQDAASPAAAGAPAASPAAAAAPVPQPPPAPAPEKTPGPAQGGSTAAASPASTPAKIAFNFKNTPWELVIDFMARQTGLPVINEAPPPGAPVTFISGAEYSVDEALDIVNRMLWMHGLQLRKEANFLLLSKVEDLKARSRGYFGQVPESVGPADIVTLVVPLNNSTAAPMAEKLASLATKGVGAITALPQQNALVIVDTAAQARRVREILTSLDSRPAADSEFKLFPLKNADAQTVFNALKGLVAEKRTTVVIDKDGQRRVVQEENFEGISIQPDARTNSIIAVGPSARLRTVQEVVALLDSDGGEEGRREMMTFALSGVTAEEAAQKISALFPARGEGGGGGGGADGRRNRPIVLALPQQSKVTVIGSGEQLRKAAVLLAELDPASAPTGGGGERVARAETQAVITPLKFVKPDQAQQVLARLLSPRQTAVLRFAPAPDGKGLIVSGPSTDVELFGQLLAAIDTPPNPDSEVRQVRISQGDVGAIAAKATELYGLSDKARTDPIRAIVDGEARAITLVGSRAALAAVTELVRTAQENVRIDRETRSFALTKSKPSDLIGAITRLARPLLEPADGGEYVAPQIEPVDEVQKLVVRAQPEQFTAIAELIASLDGAPGASRQVRLIELRNARAKEMAESLTDLMQTMRAFTGPAGPAPAVEPIEATNSLLVVGQPAQFAIVDQLARSLDARQSPERPPLRILRIETTDAASLAQTLTNQYSQRPQEQKVRQPVEVQADTVTNTLLVSAHPDVFPEIEKIVTELNALRAFDAKGREIRIFPLRFAHADELARTIDQMYPEPPMPIDPRTRQPMPERRPPREVVVRADRATNSLIVDATMSKMGAFEALVKQLDNQQVTANVEVRTYRVQRANLDAATATLRNLVSSGGLAMLPVGQQAVVTITPEPVSRSLVVTAPAEAFEGLEKVLKQIDSAPERPATGMRLFTLTTARADSAAGLIRPVLIGRARDLQQRGAIPQGVEPASLIEIAGDPASNTLIVSAPDDLLTAAGELVKALDAPAGAGGVGDTRTIEVRVFSLTKGKAESVAQAVQAGLAAGLKPGEIAPTVRAEASGNAVVVAATSARLAQAEVLIKQLDSSAQTEQIGVRTIRLKHARAGALAPMLETLLRKESALDLLPQWQRAEYLARMSQQGGAGIQPVRVAADKRLNSIVVTGPIGLLEAGEQIATELDVDPSGAAAATARGIRVITLRNADADTLLPTIQALFDDEPAGELPPTVRVEKSSNSLIVRGSEAQLASVSQLVEKVDAATLAGGRELRMIPIDRSRADARVIAETLQRLLQQRGGPKVEVISAEELLRRTGEPGAGAKPEKKGSMLPQGGVLDAIGGDGGGGGGAAMRPGFLAGRLQPLGVLRGLVIPFALAGLDEPPPTGQADPARPAPAPGAPEQAGGASAPTGQGASEPAPVTIAVDPATNSLIVVGGGKAIERITALAAELQRQMPAEPSTVRIVKLPETVDARSLATVLNTTIGQIGRSTAENPGGFTGRVSVQVDPEGSALIVSANETDFGTLGELIGAMSRPGASAKLTIKVYPLQNVPAASALQAVRDLFRPRPDGVQARRVRSVEVSIPGPDGAVKPITIDPATVNLSADPTGTALIAAAPGEAIALIDRFVALLDQSPQSERLVIRVLELKNAKATDAARTLQAAMDAVRQGGGGGGGAMAPQARFLGDDRTNAILVTATEAQLKQTERLLADLDKPQADGTIVSIIPLQVARPTTVQRIVEAVIAGRDPGRRDRFSVTASDDSSLFVFRGTAEQTEEVKRLVSEVDKQETAANPVRSLKLERADAQSVAASLKQFFDQRAQASGRPGQARKGVSIVGDRRSATLVVAASDEDFAQIQSLVARFDAPAAARDLKFRAVALENAKIGEVRQTIEALLNQIRWATFAAVQGQGEAPPADVLVFDFDERTNSVVMIGQGDSFDQAERIIKSIDVPAAKGAEVTLRAVRIEHADPRIVAAAVQGAMNKQGRSWVAADVESVKVEVDQRTRTLVLIGQAARIETALGYVSQLDRDVGVDQQIASLPLRFAAADRVAQSLDRFFRQRAAGGEESAPTLIGSRDGNVLIVSGGKDDLELVRKLLGQMDQPDEGEGRVRELFTLKNSDAAEIASTLREQFPRSLAQREGLVIVTPQASTNSLLVSAPAEMFERVSALVEQLDQPPTAEGTRIVTITLSTARSEDVAASLSAALPKAVKVKVTPVRRTNSILLTGSDEAIKLVSEQVAKLDAQPTRQQEFLRIKLQHADVSDVAFTLRQVLRRREAGPGETPPAITTSEPSNTLLISAGPDQVDEIRRIIAQIDVASDMKRTTEFVPLKFADAEQTARALEVFYGRYAPEASTPGARNVSIIANPVSRSLVISADEGEWKGLRALLEKLDNEQYDTSRRLEIVALRHADAQALARALSESFSAPLRAELERQRARQAERRQRGEAVGADAPSVLLDTKETVTITAEPLTNSVIIGAARDQVEKIKAVIAQLDVPESSRLPEARIIPLRLGPASQIAQALRQTFTDAGPQGSGRQGPRSVVIVGEDKSNALIVRAEESQFAQIKAMAETLQQEGDRSRSKVRVLTLKHVPAARVAAAVRATFANVAREAGETLAVEVDRAGNALVVASSEKLFEQIRQVAEELDGPGKRSTGPGEETVPGLGQTVQIVDIEHNSPAEIVRLIEQLGLTRAQPADRQGVVAEPVTVTTLTSRRAVAVVGSQQDILAVASLIKSLDSAPTFGDQAVAIVRLKAGAAPQVVAAVENMLKTAAADGASAPARALVEQIRRLNVQREGGADAPPLQLDLARPIRIFAEAQTNSVVVASSKENVAAVRDLVALLDRLPIGEAISVRLFPLQVASAQRVGAVIRELFAQADRLRTLPGTAVRGEPTTLAGKGLMSPVAVSIDDRTNSVIVAAQEDAAALCEVLIKQLDSDRGAGWVEPTVIQLKHADARRLAVTLRQVFVDGLRDSPEARALQQAVGRLGVLQQGKDPSDPKSRIEADLFANMSTVVITAQEQLNALVVVGSTNNLAVMRELIKMLDVPAASAANSVRVYPLQFAAAERIAGMLREIFRQQVESGAVRPEDDVAITSDARTNALVISTSGRSFAVVEGLLAKLDGEAMNPAVGLHVIPLQAGNAAQLAPRILQLMRERIDGMQRSGSVAQPRDTFSVQAEPATNSLIVAASDENLAIVKQLVEVLSRGAEALAGAQLVEVIGVKSARVDQMALALRELYVDKANRERGADAVRVQADQRLNALVVTGTAQDVDAIRTLVKRLDATPITAVTEIKRIELKKTDAVEVVRLLQNVLAGRPLSGGGAVGQRQALVLRFIKDQTAGALGDGAAKPVTEAEISGAIQEQVTLTPETRTNSIVVNAPSQLMVLIENLVSDIDTTAAGARTIEIFELQHADARAMAVVLRELFNLRQQGNSLVLVPERNAAPGGAGGGAAGAGGATTAGPPAGGVGGGAGSFGDGSQFFPTLDERQALSITIDARTNSLIVSATPEYVDEVRKVVTRLDAREVNERENLTVRLRNAKAPEVARTLREYFTEESNRVRQLLGPDRVGSLVTQLEREVIVQGDDKSNSLLVSVSPRYREKVEQLVRDIDATPPQVLIQVLLAEVTLDRAGQFGIEATFGPFGGDQVRGGYLGAGSPIGTALGVPNFSVSSVDFNLLIRALESQGRLEVLSRPQLTVRNNEKAHFQVGQNIGLADSLQTFSNGTTQTSIRREDVGIILDVTPSVSTDGYIRMDVQPTISSLSDRTTQISEQIQTAIVDKRDLQTVVTVKDGETIVLGGLIQNREQDFKTKVPGLGDIPLLGELFRSTKTSQTKTELLVLLTPRVIRSAEPGAEIFQRSIREDEINNLSKTGQIRRWLPPDPPSPGQGAAEPNDPRVPGAGRPRPDDDGPEIKP